MKTFLRQMRETALLMVGQSNYDVYRKHMAEHHPDQAPMTRVEFFRNREKARYDGAGGGRCC